MYIRMTPFQKVANFCTLGLVLFTVACSSRAPVSSFDATQANQALAGNYKFTITEEDIQRANLPSFETGLEGSVGDWLINLATDGKFTAERNGNFIAEGVYSIKGSIMEIGITNVCTDCGCANNIGRYKWTFTKDQLVLQKIADARNPMVLVLNSHPLVKQP